MAGVQFRGAQPLWSPDGSKLYWLNGGRRLTVCSVKTKPMVEFGGQTTLFPVMVPSFYTGGIHFDSSYAFDPSGNRIVAIAEPETVAPIVVMQNWRAKVEDRR